MKDVQQVFSAIKRSEFRRRIHLGQKELDYLDNKGMSEILQHAAEFIQKKTGTGFTAQ